MGFNVKNHNFYSDIFEQHKINAVYKSVYDSSNNKNINKEYFGDGEILLNSPIHSFKFVPNYLQTQIASGLIQKKVFQKHGYAAFLNDYKSVEEYIDSNCKSNFRGNIRRPLKRLELCLNIKYIMYYGTMPINTYKVLMDTFHSILKKRFEQLNARNLILENWNYYQNHAYEAICKKNASLFVMYNKDEPIAFSLNFHVEQIFYFAIPTFNLDYSKFTLGNVVIYKNLEWCFENNFKIFDMGYGGFENKVNWCNTTYDFEHHLVYNTKNGIVSLYALFLKYKYRFINYLISKNVNTKIRSFRKYLKRQEMEETSLYIISKLENFNTLQAHNLSEIKINDDIYRHLKKPLYDFLYLNTEHLDNVQIYKLIDNSQQYVFKGNKTIAMLRYTN